MQTVAPIHLVSKREGHLDRWRGGPRGMNQPAAYTPLESLFLFQSLLVHGVDPGAFARISELLKGNALIKSGDTYDPARLSPEALQHLFLLLLRDELRGDLDRTEASDTTASPASRKRKIGSPPLPTLKDVYDNVEKVPILVDRLYSRYRDHVVKQIRDDEERFEAVQKHIQVLERGERERMARVASQNAASPIAPREPKQSPVVPSGPKPSPGTAHATPTPIPRPPVTITPVPPPRPPVSSTHIAASKVALPAYTPTGNTPIRPSPSPQPPQAVTHPPPQGSPPVLQAPTAVPPPSSAQRVLQPPSQVPRPPITPRPEPSVQSKEPTPTPQPATPTPSALKWEKQYKPIQAGQSPAASASPAPPPKAVLHQRTPQPQPPQRSQQTPQPRPHPPHPPPHAGPHHPPQTPEVSSQPQTPQGRSTGKPVLVPPQGGGNLAPPLQPGQSRPPGTPIAAPPRPTSTTPIPPPTRPIQPQQTQPVPPPSQQAQRPIASASPVVPPGNATPIAPQRWTQPQTQHHPSQPTTPASSAAPTAQKDKPYQSPYIPRPPIPEHMIRHATNTPIAAKRTASLAMPQTPAPATPGSVTSGFGTKWATQSTPSTPGPLNIEPESPAFEPVSPPQRQLPLSRETPKRPLKEEKSVPKPSQKLEVLVPKAGRGRPPRSTQKSRGGSATPSYSGERRSQSVTSQTDELSLDTPIGMAKVKAEEATPRPRDETGDTTADESMPGRSHMVTPSSVARILKRKRQETPLEVPSPPAHVLWTRGFTKVSSSALDQISSHRDANMFATALREKDAPGYRSIVLQPQDITSIRSAIKQGNKAAVQAAASLPGGDPGTASVWLPVSEDLVPPRGIINSAQLERELVHMFCNAIMYNFDPYRGPGPAFIKRSQNDQEEVVGYRLDENGIVKNTQSMFLEVEKLLGDLRSAEKERSAPPPSATRLTSVATPADDTQDDEDELAGEPDSVTGTVKRRRVTTRG
ncbi:hypothetical protein B0I35DRAFT_428330 [Stachybotrys elegans]|uniref:Bromo domain-containing protein n=1 Tax=Stachybotrys elegans TaxID=80388 RepID=A0A8K0SVM2_9HYPO|nr:hypothetical protein B0I35DRAFT_428330 [Stachybotrys elegans]